VARSPRRLHGIQHRGRRGEPDQPDDQWHDDHLHAQRRLRAYGHQQRVQQLLFVQRQRRTDGPNALWNGLHAQLRLRRPTDPDHAGPEHDRLRVRRPRQTLQPHGGRHNDGVPLCRRPGAAREAGRHLHRRIHGQRPAPPEPRIPALRRPRLGADCHQRLRDHHALYVIASAAKQSPSVPCHRCSVGIAGYGSVWTSSLRSSQRMVGTGPAGTYEGDGV
jgi:hypothetical protein